MTLVDLNSSELDRIIHALRWNLQLMLENQPVHKTIQDIADGDQYLIDKLEDSLTRALEEKAERKRNEF